MRAAIAQALVSPPAVQCVAKITRRRVRHRGLTIRTDHPAFTPRTRAELFWGLYERAEITFLRRFLRESSAVIELGAGRGVSSAHIAATMPPGGTLVCVEANPHVLEITGRNLQQHAGPRDIDARLVNAAMAEPSEQTTFVVEPDLLESHLGVDKGGTGDAVTIPSVTLQQLRVEQRIDVFDLVSDVEGAEAQFIVGSDLGLDGCRTLVIELHDCSYEGIDYSAEDLLRSLKERWGFRILARKGPVAALRRG
jgi:FkbM family methyltransferase